MNIAPKFDFDLYTKNGVSHVISKFLEYLSRNLSTNCKKRKYKNIAHVFICHTFIAVLDEKDIFFHKRVDN